MNKKIIVGAVALAIAGSANAFGGWLGKQIDNMSGSGNSGKAQVIQRESAIQGTSIYVAPGQNYRIPGTTMTIIRQGGPLVKIDQPTGEHYVAILDDDPRYPRIQAYSVDCNTYRYRYTPNINQYREPGSGEYGGAVAYAACHISPDQ